MLFPGILLGVGSLCRDCFAAEQAVEIPENKTVKPPVVRRPPPRCKAEINRYELQRFRRKQKFHKLGKLEEQQDGGS